MILLAGTFLVVLLVVVAYQVFIPEVIYEGYSGTDEGVRDKLVPKSYGGAAGPDSPFGEDLKIIETEPMADGARIKRIYNVDYWEKCDDGVYLLTRPKVTLFQKDGQQITINSEKGEVVAEWIEGKPKVISGFLAGDVRIFIDRSKDQTRREAIPAEKRPEVVRIYTEKLNFSNPDLEIYTDLPIKLFSKEGDIFGRGLSLTWSENPRELRQLKINHGQKMIVHNAGEKSPVLMMPGQQAAADEASADAKKPVVVASADTATTKSTTQPGMRSNVFVADFFAGKRDVYVHSGDRSMKGSRKLSLAFEFEPSTSIDGSSKSPTPPIAPKGPIDPPGLEPGPVDVPDPSDTTVPADTARPIPIPGGSLDSPASQPTTCPAAATQPGAPKKPEPLIIEWDGPLVLRPKGHTPKPSRKRYNIVAVGPTVTLSDSESTASCASFTYNNLKQIGTLEGDKKRQLPAELLTAENERIVSEKITFDRAKGEATLEGKGYMIRQIGPVASDIEDLTTRPATQPMTRPATQPTTLPETRPAAKPATRPSTRPTTSPATQPDTQPADQPDRIEWSKSVLAIFGTDTPAAGTRKSKQYIKETTFIGDVKLKQGKTGDFVNCDELHVWMSRTASGGVQPAKAVATGNAYARQEGSDISADEITVTFKETADSKTKGDGNERVSQRVKPSTLLAVGNVKVKDDRGKEPVSASADRLESNIIERSAILTGSLARLTQGENVLAGRKIELRQERLTFSKPGKDNVVETRHYAKVIGEGNMKFMTDKDLSGRSLEKSKPIKIAWTEGMDYHPKKVIGGLAREHSAADFKGDVTVDSGDDHLECQDMEALFVEPTRKSAPAATTAPSAPMALDGAPSSGPVTMADYSQRKLIKLTANDKVVLTSRRFDADEALLRRVRLQGKHLVYNTLTGIVNMDKAGAMLAEDYRKPLPKAKVDPSDTQNIERPMLTLFKWNDSMELSQKERVVIMKGKVDMIHRSGAFVLSQIRGLKVPDYGKNVPAGRKTRLGCDEMLARFDPPKKTAPTTQPATQPTTRSSDPLTEGPRVGALKFFNATGNVNLTDGNKQLVGQRLIYSRAQELVQVYGYLPNKPKADAMIIDKNRIRNTEKVIKSPKILWWRATRANGYREKVEAEGVSVD
jgi:lipopolysaccharide export system protein LptA